MPRQARLDFEGCFHHVINRGLERREIFRDRQDYVNFKEALERFMTEDGMRCYAWVLMPNHFHLVVKTGKVPLSTFMSRLQTSYVGTFNRRHRRSGKLFQNRYKSIVCDEDVYFKELVAYVHLNPLRAKWAASVEKLAAYPWSGHRALLGLEKNPWQDVDAVLSRFGKNAKEARRRYVEYVGEKKGVKSGALSGGGLVRSAGVLALDRTGENRDDHDTRVLGDGEFVRRVGASAEKIERPVELKGSFRDFMAAVAAHGNVPLAEVVTPGKTTARGSRAREIIGFLAVSFLGKRKSAVAEELQVTPLAVTNLFRRGQDAVGGHGMRLLHDLKVV